MLYFFLQFIAERLDMLNDGRGFNDAFEEQIGLQAESKCKQNLTEISHMRPGPTL